MSNSSLINHTHLSPNCTKPRNHKIDKITIHHMAGNMTVEACGNLFANASRQASSNYGIGSDGRVGLYVDEANRAWTSGNAENDNRAVTIEVANDGGSPDWHVSDKALAKLIDLCVDICKRNGIEKLNFTGDKTGNLTMHKWFQATSCPGPYLESKFPYIAEEVNKRLNTSEKSKVLYRVQVGAYSDRKNALKMLTKLKAAGFNGIIKADGTGSVVEEKEPEEEVKKVTVGSTVRVKNGAKTYEGKNIASFIYNRNHKVHQINGDRAVITYNNIVVAAVKLEDLYLV